MKNIMLVIMVAGFLSACVITPACELPIRSPQQFLNDVKIVADAGDLENVKFVSKWLRVDYQRGAKRLVYDEGGQFVKGYVVDVTRYAFSREYSRDGGFVYDIYQPKGRDSPGVFISLPIDSSAICIAPYDFIDVFDDVSGYPIVRWGLWACRYTHRDRRIAAAKEHVYFQ
ncbi:hypothetical protein [Burkholderia sp. Bp8963]|uniref:hypothetical protein n=1 Tax=Burkholderia sp. Bp8963 TaxID=2184547 RepID=UPI000F5938A4|nr:hypothetical protein [Burkholderia sp. Bp8963]